MSKELYRVMIIEDDFRVANINKEFVNKVVGFLVIEVAHTGKDALEKLEAASVLPDLILLDVYIPDVEGLELMWDIRKKYQNIDIIMITAAKEVETIEETFRGGIVDYIVKPVDFTRLEQTLMRFQEKQRVYKSKQEMTQAEIDRLQGLTTSDAPADNNVISMPKGIDRLTLDKVVIVMEKTGHEGITAVEMSKHIGTSRSTARRYLEYLVATNQAKAELIYGDVGRPERRYVNL